MGWVVIIFSWPFWGVQIMKYRLDLATHQTTGTLQFELLVQFEVFVLCNICGSFLQKKI